MSADAMPAPSPVSFYTVELPLEAWVQLSWPRGQESRICAKRHRLQDSEQALMFPEPPGTSCVTSSSAVRHVRKGGGVMKMNSGKIFPEWKWGSWGCPGMNEDTLREAPISPL